MFIFLKSGIVLVCVCVFVFVCACIFGLEEEIGKECDILRR